ncbi:MAG TPA: hypothetical protein VF154_06305, partial [Terriglobales bacterium]
AANYLLAQKTDLDEALTYENQSIEVEKRFDNLLTKSNILEALNRKDEADTTRKQALALANPLQLHIYARQLQGQKRQDEAFVIFRENARKHPEEWFVHSGMARIYCSQGKFDDAVKEMNVALAGAPDGQKTYVEGLVKRLQAKQDIN